MDNHKTINASVIGCGGMARHHVRKILANFEKTTFLVLCEPSKSRYDEIAKIFVDAGRDVPPNEPDLSDLLEKYGNRLDAAFIITPHVFHYNQARACLEKGIDV